MIHKTFCDIKLNYNLVVSSTTKIIELCYSLAYKEHFSIIICSSIGIYGIVYEISMNNDMPGGVVHICHLAYNYSYM